MKRILGTLLLTGLFAMLGACETTPEAEPENGEGAKVEERGTGPGDTEATTPEGATPYGVGPGGTFQGHPLDNPQGPLSTRVIYFDFDSNRIREQDHATIRAHAEYLAANPQSAVVLEGHADERGTREYNIALGDRRSKAVLDLMTLLGAGGNQLSTVSYGEERPASSGGDEEAWELNRRVELNYVSR